MRSRLAPLVLLATTAFACGSLDDKAGPAPGGTPAAEPPPAPAVDHGAPSGTYPAFTPDMPRLVNQGGRILTSPVVVTIAWDDNPKAAEMEQLVDTIGSTSYWHDVVGEYGVGPLSSGAGNHFRVSTPLVIPDDPNLDPVQPVADFLQANLSDLATSHWPAPTDQSLYLVYLAGSNAAKLCDLGMGGMHESLKVNGKDVAYAIVLACPGDPTGATISASHELAEAATDPYPDVDGAWQGLDPDHLAWELFQSGQDENGDMCELYEDAYGMVAPELPFPVQRQWSNKSALAGHSPCVTAGKEPYFNVTPLDAKDDLVADFGSFQAPFAPRGKGLHVGVGETKTLTLGIYSDGPTDDIKLSASEVDPFGDPMSATPAHDVDLAFDKATGKNGEKVHLSVTVKKASGIGVHVVLVQASLPGQNHMFPLLVGGNPADPARRLTADGTHATARTLGLARTRTPRLARVAR